MIGKYFFGALAVAILLVTASISAVAQVGELRGTVMMKQADGQKVPLAEAQIDVFRVDIKGEYKTKTNKKGEFVFAGIPFVGTYVVVFNVLGYGKNPSLVVALAARVLSRYGLHTAADRWEEGFGAKTAMAHSFSAALPREP